MIGGGLLYALGVMSGAPISVGRYLLGQSMVSAAQITAHYVNEYADVEVDRHVANRTLFSGGSGVLVSGKLSRNVGLRAAMVSSALTLAVALAIAAEDPLPAVLGLLALAVSWAYSIPPFRLLGTGWGEFVTTLVVTLVVPLIGVTITGDGPPMRLWWSIGILIPIHMAMMLVFELPDLESDRANQKLVLGARIGSRRTILLVTLLLVLAETVLALRLMEIGSSSLYLALIGGGAGSLAVVGAIRRHRHVLSTALSVALLAVTTIILIFANRALS